MPPSMQENTTIAHTLGNTIRTKIGSGHLVDATEKLLTQTIQLVRGEDVKPPVLIFVTPTQKLEAQVASCIDEQFGWLFGAKYSVLKNNRKSKENWLTVRSHHLVRLANLTKMPKEAACSLAMRSQTYFQSYRNMRRGTLAQQYRCGFIATASDLAWYNRKRLYDFRFRIIEVLELDLRGLRPSPREMGERSAVDAVLIEQKRGAIERNGLTPDIH